MSEELQYLNLVQDVLDHGIEERDRTGVGTLSVFGRMTRWSLSKNNCFPLLTTKRVFWRAVVEELLWFIRGETDAKILQRQNIHIWDGNSTREFLDSRGLQQYTEGDIGPGYGFQWRHFGAIYLGCDEYYAGQGVDQLQNIINSLNNFTCDGSSSSSNSSNGSSSHSSNGSSSNSSHGSSSNIIGCSNRRMIMTAWNPVCIDEMALPPCHMMAQFYIGRNNELSCSMYQRSCDLGLGVPFNIASYALLTCLLAHHCGLQRGEFVHFMGNVHIYKTHIDALKEQCERGVRPFPTLAITGPRRENISDYTLEDFDLSNYTPYSSVPMQMAV